MREFLLLISPPKMPYTLSPLGSKERLIPRLGTSNPEMLCGVVGKRHKNALWENGAPFRSSLGRGAVAPHPKQKRGAKSPPPPHPPTDVLDNTCDISDFREHILCPQNYLRIKQDCLNNYPLIYCHK